MNIMTRNSYATSSFALALGLVAALITTTASASGRHLATERYTEFADVISVQPVYKDVRVREPRKECWIETQQRVVGYEPPRYEHYQAHRSERRHSSGNAVIGGVIGGVIGNQLGRGHSSGSRAGATIAGAIIGSTVANEARGEPLRHRRPHSVQRRGAPIYETVEVERCEKVSSSRIEQRIQHYDVTYRYRGKTFTSRMDRDPGNRIELQVSVSPARR